MKTNQTFWDAKLKSPRIVRKSDQNSTFVNALQLSAALVWCFEKPKGRIFVCCDGKLSDAAKRIGFTVIPK